MDNTILDQSKDDDQKKSKKGRIILRNLTKAQKEKLKTVGLSGFLGVLGGIGAFSLMSFVEDPENPMPPEPAPNPEPDVNPGSDVNPNMNSDPVVIYTEAPFASGIDDSMSFNEAFATARDDVGGGGFFEWRGNTYGTYLKEEWDSLTEADKDDYWDSIAEGTSKIEEEEIVDNSIEQEQPQEAIYTISEDDIETVDINDKPEEQEQPEDNIYTITEDDYIETVDVNDDGIIDAAVVDANSNDLPDMVLDTDMDGEMDILVLDVDPETGEISGNENVIFLDNEPELAYVEQNEPVNSNNIDLYDNEELNPDIDIDNNEDMSDYIA